MTKKSVKPNLRKSAIQAPNSYNENENSAKAKQPVQVIEANLDQIQNYEENPRFLDNALFHDIKNGIENAGSYTGVLDVTRRPDENHFITYFGAGTRLLALKTLYEETGNPDYYRVNVAVHSYPGEARLLSNHLAENQLRDGLKMIETAMGALQLKDKVEEELSKELSDKAFAEYTVKELPYKVQRQRLPEYRFIVELNDYCPAAVQKGMGRPKVLDLMKVKSSLATLCEKLEIADSVDDIYINALLEYQSEEEVNPEDVMKSCVEFTSGSYTELSTNELWGVLNEETDVAIPKDQKINKPRGISLKFLPKQIVGLVAVDDSGIVLTLPGEALDRTDESYPEACVAYNLLLPLSCPAKSVKRDFMANVSDLVGGLDMTILSDVSKDAYEEIIKGINGLNSKLNSRGE